MKEMTSSLHDFIEYRDLYFIQISLFRIFYFYILILTIRVNTKLTVLS